MECHQYGHGTYTGTCSWVCSNTLYPPVDKLDMKHKDCHLDTHVS